MMRSLLTRLLVILPLLLLSSTSCTREVPVPVLMPRTPCPLQPVPPFPDLAAEVCGDKVCMPADRAAQLYTWVRDVGRELEMANVCLSDSDSPKLFTGYDPHSTVDYVVSSLSMGGRVKVHVVYWDCGEINAIYFPVGVMVVCNETIAQAPQLLPFTVAHEMGHAIIAQLHLPITGSEEVAADELATLFLAAHERWDDIMAMANYFAESPDPPYWDAHPSGKHRGFTIRCIAGGALGNTNFGCDQEYLRTVNTWTTLLEGALHG